MTIKTIRKPTVVQFTKYIIHSFAHITLDQVSIPKQKKKSRGHHHTLNHDNKKQVKLVKVKSSQVELHNNLIIKQGTTRTIVTT